MKILLVNPAKYDVNGSRERYRFGSIPPSGLVALASRAKRFTNVNVTIVDEWIEDIPFDGDFDLVGISTLFSATFPRVAEISKRFQRRHIPVVLGGTHATCASLEAAAVADSVVVGEGEGLFEELIADTLSGGGIKREYKREGFLDLEKEMYIEPDYSLLDLPRYMKVGPFSKSNIFPIQTSRGCPMNCAFCSIHITGGRTPRHRPIGNVVNEILFLKREYGARYLGLYDDNLTADAHRFKELMTELSKLDIKFWCQISSVTARNPEMIELLAGAGCVSALVGIESINRSSLEEVSKSFNDVRTYREMFALFRRCGLTAMASMIFGFDHDNEDVFSESVAFLNSCGVPRALFNVLVPFPGTRLHEAMTAEGRILETNLSLYDVAHVVFAPKLMTRDDLQEGFWRAYRQFYSMGPIARRVARRSERSRFYVLFGSLTFRRQIRKRVFPYSSGYRRIGGNSDSGRRQDRTAAAGKEHDSGLSVGEGAAGIGTALGKRN